MLNDYFDVSARHVGLAETAVWCALYRCAVDGIAKVGQADLAKRLGCNQGTISKAIRRLVKAGQVEVIQNGYNPRKAADQGKRPAASVYKLYGLAKQ